MIALLSIGATNNNNMIEQTIKIKLYTYNELDSEIKKKVFMNCLNHYGTDLLIDDKLKINKKLIEDILNEEDNLFFADGEKAKINSYAQMHEKHGIREIEFKKTLHQLEEN